MIEEFRLSLAVEIPLENSILVEPLLRLRPCNNDSRRISSSTSVATSTKEFNEANVGRGVDLEAGGPKRVGDEEEGRTSLSEMVTPFSLTDLEEPST